MAEAGTKVRNETYSSAVLASIYELGRLYYETGYFAPAERIFSGLAAVDNGQTPARLGLGVIKLERGLFPDSTAQFRLALQGNLQPIRAKLGLTASFIAQGDFARARAVLAELEREPAFAQAENAELKVLLETLIARVG